MAEGALGSAQSVLFMIGNRNLGLHRQSAAKGFIGTLIRARKISPGIRKALQRRGDDAQADQDHQSHKPACMKNVRQAGDIEKAQHGWRVSALHVVGIGNRTLQNDRTRRGKDNDQNNQNDAGLDGAQGLPDFASRQMK